MKDIIHRLRTRAPRGIASCGARVQVARPLRWFNPARIEIGSDITVGRDSLFNPIAQYEGSRHPAKITLGNSLYIGENVHLAAMGHLVIEDECVLSDYVYINDAMHGFDFEAGPIMKQPIQSKGNIHIGRRCFIGYGARILSGVTLGDGCIVGSNAVVTQSFPPYSMIGGVPARLLKRYNAEGRVWRSVEQECSSQLWNRS